MHTTFCALNPPVLAKSKLDWSYLWYYSGGSEKELPAADYLFLVGIIIFILTQPLNF